MTPDECNQLNTVLNALSAYKELFSIDSYLIQPHLIHVDQPSSNESNPRHNHRTFEYSYLLAGEMVYRIRGVEHRVKQGDAVLVPPGLEHSWEVTGRDTQVFGFMLYISSQGEGSQLRLERLHAAAERHRFQIPGFSELGDIVERILGAVRRNPDYLEEKIRCLTHDAYVELFNAILPRPSGTRRLPTPPPQLLRGGSPRNLVDAVIFFVNDNSYRPLTPAEISRHLGLSLNRLNEVMKKHHGRTLGQIIWDRKIFLACNLLDNTNRQVKDIAASLGVDNVTYFCRTFRKYRGVSPALYRLLNRQ